MRRIILDSNLLLLLIIGEADRGLIGSHKRLRQYDDGAFDLLTEVVRNATHLFLTPNVLTEVSNLACQGVSATSKSRIRDTLAAFSRLAEEIYIPSRRAVGNGAYLRLGLTDAVLLEVGHGSMLWTDDMDLYLAAASLKLPVENFTHLRAERGNL